MQRPTNVLLASVLRQLAKVQRPPPRLTVDEWAEQYRHLSPESSAEPGKWRNARGPHLVAPMRALSPSNPAQEVVLCFSSQTGKTEVLNNFVGYVIDQDPGPMMVIQPNVKPMAEAWSKDRLAPMIRDTPALIGKIALAKGRDSGNTMLHKTFAGGHVTVGGANSPAGLASRPIRFLAFDEIDRYDVTKEGHAIPLASKRTLTFWNRKILKVSSPSYEGRGILAEYDDCDTISERCLPCERCGEFQYPGLRHFEWKDRGITDAEYVCEHCEHRHSMRYEHRAKLRGEWIERKTGEGRKVGFRMNQFASPFASWVDTLEEFLRCKDDPEKLQTFVNTALAEGWEERSEAVKPASILSRRERYPADVPEGVSILTAGVDVQGDRLELYVLGFGAGEEMWYIDAMPLFGLPDQPDVWTQLDQALSANYRTEDGQQLGISAALIDSGFATAFVYDFASTRFHKRIFASKGIPGEGKAILGRRSQYQIPSNRRKGWLYPVGVDGLKALLYGRLAITAHGPGYIHVPGGHALFSDEFAEQLTAETPQTKHRKGFAYQEWVKIRPRNEALDCTVLAIAALRLVPNYERQLVIARDRRINPRTPAPNTPKEPQQRSSWLNTRGKWL